jgi:hypothetical protein
MNNPKILIAITAIILASIACGVNIDLPINTDIKTGPTETDSINIPLPDDPDTAAELTLSFGAGELNLSPGQDTYLISGEVSYNVSDLKPEITVNGSRVRMETGNLEIDGIPNFNDRVENKWDLMVGSNPLDLIIKAGAYKGAFDFGGLSLNSLRIADGASDVDITFSQPNNIPLQSLRYETGASNIKLLNLANANFNTMLFEGGAGNYELDFSGNLQREATVFIETGLSSLEISVPANTNTQVNVEGGLTNITSQEAWERADNQFNIIGEGPRLIINIQMSAGNLSLTNP